MQAAVVEEALAAVRGAPAVRVARLQARLGVRAEVVQANDALSALLGCCRSRPCCGAGLHLGGMVGLVLGGQDHTPYPFGPRPYLPYHTPEKFGTQRLLASLDLLSPDLIPVMDVRTSLLSDCVSDGPSLCSPPSASETGSFAGGRSSL